MNDKLNDLIAREDYECYDSNQREWLMFNYCQKIDRRIIRLETRKRFDTGISAVTGLIGGIVAVVGKWFYFNR
jgi:hypothetical protein